MILDTLDNLDKYASLNPLFPKAIEFLNRLDNTGAINIVYGMVSTTAELITTK